MTNFSLKLLTDKQQRVWIMRYRYGWRLKKIALELGTSIPNVSRIIRRAQLKAGVQWPYHSVIRTRPRKARPTWLFRY